jgi:hypothetical protein
MRTVLIRIEGAKRRRIRKLQLPEGTRVSDILRYLKVPDRYVLALASHPTRPLPQEAEVHALVADADHLIARSRSAAVRNADAFTLSLSK